MDRDRLLSLLDDYLEQRLSADDRAALNAELVASAEARRLFWSHVHQHALLVEVVAEARGRQLAAEETVTILESPVVPTAAPSPAVAAASRLRWMMWLSGTALLVFVLVGTALLHQPRDIPSPELADGPALGRLGEVRGNVTVSADQGNVPAMNGQVLRSGQEIRTGEGGFAVVTCDDDDSRLELTPDTAIRLLEHTGDRPGSFARQILLVKGVINASLSAAAKSKPMMLSTPQVDLLAPGARFSSTSLLGETRIEMERGKGLLKPRGENRSIEIQTGTYAVSAGVGDMEVFRPAPMLPASSLPAAVLDDPTGPILSMVPVQAGKRIAMGCWDGTVKLWDVQTHEMTGLLDAGQKRIHAMACASDGRQLAVSYEPAEKSMRDRCVTIWDVVRQQPLTTLLGSRRAQSLAFMPDNRTLALAGQERNSKGVLLWDPQDPRPRFVMGEWLDRVQTIAVSPDGKTIAAGYRDGKIRLWDTQTSRSLVTLTGHTRNVQALAFQADGKILASGSRDGTIRLWSMAENEQIRELSGKFGEVRCLAFSPDGQTLASGHAGVALLWNVLTGQQHTSLKAHKFAITAIAYLPDGQTLITAGWDRAVKLWDLMPATIE